MSPLEDLPFVAPRLQFAPSVIVGKQDKGRAAVQLQI